MRLHPLCPDMQRRWVEAASGAILAAGQSGPNPQYVFGALNKAEWCR